MNTSLLFNEHFCILQQHRIRASLSKLLRVALSKGRLSFAVLRLALICQMTPRSPDSRGNHVYSTRLELSAEMTFWSCSPESQAGRA